MKKLKLKKLKPANINPALLTPVAATGGLLLFLGLGDELFQLFKPFLQHFPGQSPFPGFMEGVSFGHSFTGFVGWRGSGHIRETLLRNKNNRINVNVFFDLFTFLKKVAAASFCLPPAGRS
jgi:hypothetical protein